MFDPSTNEDSTSLDFSLLFVQTVTAYVSGRGRSR